MSDDSRSLKSFFKTPFTKLKTKGKFPEIKRSPTPINPDEVDQQQPASQTETSSTNQIDNSKLQETPPPLQSKDNATSIRDLWNVAYEKLRKEDEHLIEEYEAGIRQSLSASISLTIGSNLSARDRMDKVLRSKMDEVNRDAWKLRFGSSEVQVKDLAQPVLGVIKWANEYITGAVSSNPYASMAWTGVSLLLPVIINPSEQSASLAKGLEYISSLIIQSYLREDLYVRRYEAKKGEQEPSQLSHSAYKDSLELLYKEILRYQATSYCYHIKNATTRLGLDIVKWNDWAELLSRIQEQERQFGDVEQLWRDSKYDEESVAAERRHRETMHQWSDISLDLSGLRTAIESAQAEGSRWMLLSWLCSVDPSELYNSARDKHGAGTGDWLVASNEFKHWEISPSSLLWLHGKAGAGKSILSSVVIKHLQDQHTSDPLTALAYFYFSFSDLEKQKVASMLTSLVKQLCSQRPDTPRLVQKLQEFKDKGQRPDIETLEKILIAIAEGFTAVYIIIDALDECPTLQGERKKLLSSLRYIITNAPANLHILCTSRKEADIDAVISGLLLLSSKAAAEKAEAEASIDLSAHRDALDRDIGLFIDLTLASEEYSSWPKDIKEEARKSLIEKADGMFQYVFSQFEILQHLSSPALIRKALQDLPIGLDATYDRLLLRLNPTFQAQIINCLKWLAFSKDTLTVEQLSLAFILFPKRALVYDETERLFCPKDVLKYLSGLIVVEEKEEDVGTSRPWSHVFVYVRLAHFSIKEYLLSDRIFEGPARAFSFSDMDAHLHIAHSCLAYHLQHEGDVDWIWQALDLKGYAIRHWASHLEMVPRASWPNEVTQAALRALTTRYPSFSKIIQQARNYIAATESEFQSNLRQPQCFTAVCGYLQLTELLLSRDNGANIYLTQEDVDVALHCAASGWDIAAVKFCLSKGADINSESKFFGDALHVAVRRGNEAIVSLLLDRGADINAQRGEWGTALQVAADRGNFFLLKFLVSRGADIHAWSDETGCALTSSVPDFGSETECLQHLLGAGADINRGSGSPYGTALQKAAFQERGNCLRLLLERGADVKAPGGKYGNALQAAACSMEYPRDDNFRNIKLLLDSGADVNAQGGKYGNALQAACRFKGASVVRLLIDRGAWINAEGGEFGTALQAACLRRHSDSEVVKLLLENGADPNIQGGKYGNALNAVCGNPDAGWQEEKAQMLLQSGADINANGAEHGSAIHAAAASRSSPPPNVLQLLLDNGVDVNVQGGLYGSALQAACAAGNLWAVRLLLYRGAEVNAEGGKYGTALQAACTLSYWRHSSEDRDNFKLLESLLEAGANVHTQGGFHGSAWHAAAATSGSPDILEMLLDRGVNVNDACGKQYPTALLAAVASYGSVDFLLDHGADVNLTVGTFGSALQFACANENETYQSNEVINMLDNCANLDINQRGGRFGSALQAAAWTGRTKAVKGLLSKGADVNTSGGEFGSPLNAAVCRGNWDTVETLLDASAVPDCFQFKQADEVWLAQIHQKYGRGAVERYRVFWDKQKEMGQRGKESILSS